MGVMQMDYGDLYLDKYCRNSTYTDTRAYTYNGIYMDVQISIYIYIYRCLYASP